MDEKVLFRDLFSTWRRIAIQRRNGNEIARKFGGCRHLEDFHGAPRGLDGELIKPIDKLQNNVRAQTSHIPQVPSPIMAVPASEKSCLPITLP